MANGIKQFKIYNHYELNKLSQLFDHKVSQWAKTWLSANDNSESISIQVSINNAFEVHQTSECFVAGFDHSASFVIATAIGYAFIPDEVRSELLGKLLSSDIMVASFDRCAAANTLLKNCIDDFMQSFLMSQNRTVDKTADSVIQVGNVNQINSVSRIDRSDQVNDFDQPWQDNGSGWLYVEITIGTILIPILLFPENIQRCTELKDKQFPSQFDEGKKAIVDQQVHMLAQLGSVSLTIGDFQSLSCGDVLQLDTLFSDKIVMKTKSGTAICSGMLGENSGKRAVKVTEFY